MEALDARLNARECTVHGFQNLGEGRIVVAWFRDSEMPLMYKTIKKYEQRMTEDLRAGVPFTKPESAEIDERLTRIFVIIHIDDKPLIPQMIKWMTDCGYSVCLQTSLEPYYRKGTTDIVSVETSERLFIDRLKWERRSGSFPYKPEKYQLTIDMAPSWTRWWLYKTPEARRFIREICSPRDYPVRPEYEAKWLGTRELMNPEPEYFAVCDYPAYGDPYPPNIAEPDDDEHHHPPISKKRAREDDTPTTRKAKRTKK